MTSQSQFINLLALSRHRGPDATHFEGDNFYQLGFNRLALLDLSDAGLQPKLSPQNRFHMVFNGEVYNYKELAQKYNLSNLRSTSDTEVILHLFDKIGVHNALKELNGMFAIAVVDAQTKQLYLTRDFAGIKPLFYGVNSRGVVFASQFDQVFKHAWFKKNLKLRNTIVAEYFSFGYMQAPNTVYENIFQVNPGECLIVDQKQKIKNIEIVKFSKKFNPAKNNNYKTIKAKISKAVNRQLNTDRTIASFLSGGIDSSLISAVAKQECDTIEAFTIEVDDIKLNEAEHAKAYAKHLKLKHQVIKITNENILKHINKHFKSFSEPFGDYSSLPSFLITKEAAKYHTAMLSGDGGDELFFGYPRMHDVLLKYRWFKIHYLLRTNLVRITNKLKLTNTFAPFEKNMNNFYLAKHIKLPKNITAQCFENHHFSSEMESLYFIPATINKNQLQHYLRWNEFYGHLQRILIKVDRTSMKNSLEVRIPFLDKEVIEEAWQSMHDISEIQNLKKPIKEILYNYLPKELLMKSKKGFTVPMKKFLRNELKSELIRVVIDSPFFGSTSFNTQPLVDYVTDFIENKHQNEWGVWHIYAWQKWAINQKFIEEHKY